MSSDYLIIHGTGGTSEGNWFPWLKTHLENQGKQVFCPQFPTPDKQNLHNWFEKFEEIKQTLKGPVTIIGHSLGCAFALRLIEKNALETKSCILVSPFVSKLNLEFYDNLNSSFIENKFNWDFIKRRGNHFSCFSGSNDPYVDLKISEQVAYHLNVELKIIENGGHLNSEFGFTKAEFLIPYL